MKKFIKYLEFPGTHPSYENYCKMEIVRDIKENICRVNISFIKLNFLFFN